MASVVVLHKQFKRRLGIGILMEIDLECNAG